MSIENKFHRAYMILGIIGLTDALTSKIVEQQIGNDDLGVITIGTTTVLVSIFLPLFGEGAYAIVAIVNFFVRCFIFWFILAYLTRDKKEKLPVKAEAE